MSFLNQLKTHAEIVRTRQQSDTRNLTLCTDRVEQACEMTWKYWHEMVRQLSIIEPKGASFSLDGKTFWPEMRLVDFHIDSRKKMLRNREVYDYVQIHWRIVPRHGDPVPAEVVVNFPTELDRITRRLELGGIKHDRKDIRHPKTNALQGYHFDYETAASGAVTMIANHDQDCLIFKLRNLDGFLQEQSHRPASDVSSFLLDELAKRIVGEPSRFS